MRKAPWILLSVAALMLFTTTQTHATEIDYGEGLTVLNEDELATQDTELVHFYRRYRSYYYPRYYTSYRRSYYYPRYSYRTYSYYPRYYRSYSYYPRYYSSYYYPRSSFSFGVSFGRYYGGYCGIAYNPCATLATTVLLQPEPCAPPPVIINPVQPINPNPVMPKAEESQKPATPKPESFPYNGGPKDPVPMPEADKKPTGDTPKALPPRETVPLDGHAVSLPTPKAQEQYTYQAYGASPQAKSDFAQGRTVLISRKPR